MNNYPDPIEYLLNEHAVGREVLSTLEEAVNSIEKIGFTADAFKKIVGAVEFIGSKLKVHYDMEDQHLYPLLQRRAVSSQNVTRHERREMWQSFKELTISVKDIEDGKVHATTIRELIKTARAVVEYFRNHIEREEEIVFPMVKRLLTPDEYADLAKEIAERA